jgi:uncharacterized membrane protein YgcG
MKMGRLVGLAYPAAYEHPLQPTMVVFSVMSTPLTSMTRRYVFPVHMAPGTPAVGHVLACTELYGGIITTQSNHFWFTLSTKLVHVCKLVPGESGRGGGGAGGSAGGGGELGGSGLGGGTRGGGEAVGGEAVGGESALKLYATVPVQYTGPFSCMG